jgi:hypothetical protein
MYGGIGHNRYVLPPKAHIQLTRAEAGSASRKLSSASVRSGISILVCFLAFVLWKVLEMWQQRAGLGNSPATILEKLARIQSHDVALPTASLVRSYCAASLHPTRHKPLCSTASA